MEKTMTPVVAAIGQLPQVPHLQFPVEWFSYIVFDNGRPHLQAMTILADAIFWYQPVPVRDAESGMIVRYERSFEGEHLQRSYAYYEDRFGMSIQQARTALDKLEALDVAHRIVKDVLVRPDGKPVLSNVMYVSLNPQKIYEISVPKAMRDATHLLYITDPSVIHNRPLCYTQQTYTDKTIYREDKKSACENLNVSPSNQGSGDYFGLPGLSVDRRVLSIQTRLLDASKVGLTAISLRENAEQLAKIHGVAELIDVDDNEYAKMQDMAIQLARLNLRTNEQIQSLYVSWMKEDGIGRKETACGELPKPPKGNLLVKHASWLRQEGRIDDSGNIKQLLDGDTTSHSNGTTRNGTRRVKTGVIGERTKAIEAARASIDGDVERLQKELQEWFESGAE